MKKRMIIAIVSICTVLSTGCGSETVKALEQAGTVEETEVIATETMEVTETETEEVISLEGIVEETESITEEDYIALVKSCEQEFKILDGKEYDCEIAIDLRGCIYVYEFPEEDVKAEESCLLFDYENAEMGTGGRSQAIGVPISLVFRDNNFLIGYAYFFVDIDNGIVNAKVNEISYYYEDYRDRLSYEIFSEKADELKHAIIRDYNPEDRTVELCYVTAIDCDTYADYEIENEEWISVSLSEDAKIVAWSWGYTCAAFVSEEVFADSVEYWLDTGYFFATIYEGDGCIQGIAQIFNP